MPEPADILRFTSELPSDAARVRKADFLILIVDDDADVHSSTKHVLEWFYPPDDQPGFLHAYSGSEACTLLTQNRDIAVVLLDVIMETFDAGLLLVNTIRHELGLTHTQIILRTGQPGKAIEDDVVAKYAINGYLNKSDLTPERLFSAVTTAQRAYALLRKQAKVTAALEELLNATARHVGDMSLDGFILDAMARFAAMFETPCQGLFLRLIHPDQAPVVAVATTEFSALAGLSLTAFEDHELRDRIATCLQTRKSIIDGKAATLYLPGARFLPAVMHLIRDRDHGSVEHYLLDVLIVTFVSGSDNLTIALANSAIQTQLVQSEKMASLGLLTANVVHEINTPIAAIKSSGETIATALDDMLLRLPTVLQSLDQEHRGLFLRLITPPKRQVDVLSSREERIIVRETTRQLEELGIADARYKAGLLVKLNAQAALTDYLPLLRHAQYKLILDVGNDMAAIINGTSNVNNAVNRVAKIILALKSFSRIDHSAERVYANLREGLETVLTIYQGQIKHGIELARHYEDVPSLLCLPDELNQVWTNLIHNALQAMNHQGTLTVGVRRAGDELVVSVGDSGCGIPEAIREKIFDVFFTTKPVGVGSGLGLDIVKKIIDKHQGRIAVESEVGVGTTFSVHLPLNATA